MKVRELFEVKAEVAPAPSDPAVKNIADRVMDEFADAKTYNLNAIRKRAYELLSREPGFKDNPDKIENALKEIGEYLH